MHEITLVSPFPAGEGGRGDRGQGSKLKAGQGGDKEGTFPAGYSGGKTSRRPVGHAPRRASGSPLLPVPLGFSPGMQGAKPLA